MIYGIFHHQFSKHLLIVVFFLGKRIDGNLLVNLSRRTYNKFKRGHGMARHGLFLKSAFPKNFQRRIKRKS
jgi:hypothetical protein